jgi:protein-disulfide isomerase
VEYARQSEKNLTAKDSLEQQVRVISTLTTALKNSGMAAEAAATETRLVKLETELDREYLATVPPFKPTPFAGRKEKSDRAVVMELFTGAQCPPCVAADVAFDALEKSYKASEVVLIQYHLHIPGPDPMTNAATEARAKYYGANSTPTVLFNGKNVSALDANVRGGGNMAMAQERYGQYSQIINKLVEEQAGAAVKLDTRRQGDVITLHADVSKVPDPGADKKLRFLLVEETIRFVGSNKLRFHHMVVRAMPAGPDGIALTRADSQHTATVNLADLRQELTKYLDDYAANKSPFPQPGRPMDFKGLKAIALVQDDKTKEILQAVVVNFGGDHAAP